MSFMVVNKDLYLFLLACYCRDAIPSNLEEQTGLKRAVDLKVSFRQLTEVDILKFFLGHIITVVNASNI